MAPFFRSSSTRREDKTLRILIEDCATRSNRASKKIKSSGSLTSGDEKTARGYFHSWDLHRNIASCRCSFSHTTSRVRTCTSVSPRIRLSSSASLTNRIRLPRVRTTSERSVFPWPRNSRRAVETRFRRVYPYEILAWPSSGSGRKRKSSVDGTAALYLPSFFVLNWISFRLHTIVANNRWRISFRVFRFNFVENWRLFDSRMYVCMYI